jgi:hypothetical protein
MGPQEFVIVRSHQGSKRYNIYVVELVFPGASHLPTGSAGRYQ